MKAEPNSQPTRPSRRWKRTLKAANWAWIYFQDKGEWPAIKQIAGQTEVSAGTACNALKAARRQLFNSEKRVR
ncbi:hypothetical protein CCAX7_14680 [Capsulimonas corticalis]|uniref:Uncharacterized protein n=1 Tax=Capsulimonas corticalis TaxID=2219043 RepID=A0A402CZH4_9BACT|nr:hypothetical protein [Capsulimonas corticalis]BDI29417.1 hypothetical protein CCAX7_14680 [Capsulimonas corticalis]